MEQERNALFARYHGDGLDIRRWVGLGVPADVIAGLQSPPPLLEHWRVAFECWPLEIADGSAPPLPHRRPVRDREREALPGRGADFEEALRQPQNHIYFQGQL